MSSASWPRWRKGFKRIGYAATIPLALMLVTLASVPVADDLMVFVRKDRTKH
jgi:hypothetical protein